MARSYASPKPFREWMEQQCDRQDRVGRLARTLSKLSTEKISWARKRDEHKLWAGIIVRYGTSDEVRSFNRAWREYQSTATD